jgi:hypothetical protein
LPLKQTPLIIMSALLLLGLALRSAVPLHVDLALKSCDPNDAQQKWELGTPVRGCGYPCAITHQSTKLCLMPKGCSDEPGTPLELGDCAAGCTGGNKVAGQFTISHSRNSLSTQMQSHHVATATSGEPSVVMMPSKGIKDSNSPDDQSPDQMWTTAKPYTGPGHTMQIGKSADGKGYGSRCPADPCCLSVHTDVIDDGEGGWALTALLLSAAVLYEGAGVALGISRPGPNPGGRGISLHPHWARWMEGECPPLR